METSNGINWPEFVWMWINEGVMKSDAGAA